MLKIQNLTLSKIQSSEVKLTEITIHKDLETCKYSKLLVF
jgi:hypothetical protein